MDNGSLDEKFKQEIRDTKVIASRRTAGGSWVLLNNEDEKTSEVMHCRNNEHDWPRCTACSSLTCTTVISLDNKGVLLLNFTINWSFCSETPFSRCLVQHYSFKRKCCRLSSSTTLYKGRTTLRMVKTGEVRRYMGIERDAATQ
ncbi:hypothetical protein XENTR_v10014675 [Xenopus tropicalis]|nr:hypothetical protein XENTR_v10014675 [Xenopus tropicalis]